VTRVVTLLALAAISALLASGCGGGDGAKQAAAAPASKPSCPRAWLVTWQKLANRIDAPVYCPAWLPDPLTGQIAGRWSNIDSVDPDRSYLESFVWQETGPGAAGGELHVNLRGYPGFTRIPTCKTVDVNGKIVTRGTTPCFADPRGTKRIGGITATVYTVNQDADQWHVLYAWRHRGSLYTLSEHVAPPLNYRKVVANLDRMLGSLELVPPRSTEK
jgi:hypothetical protein